MKAGHRRVVVVVEDDAGMRDAIHRVLEATGFAVTDFAAAEAALQDHATREAHCLVLDIHLPGISGFELYERLGELGSKPPVIFITARDDIRNQERAKQLGALDYLVKPFSGRALAAIVARALP
jgi:FixJ family two-component response regulator